MDGESVRKLKEVKDLKRTRRTRTKRQFILTQNVANILKTNVLKNLPLGYQTRNIQWSCCIVSPEYTGPTQGGCLVFETLSKSLTGTIALAELLVV